MSLDNIKFGRIIEQQRTVAGLTRRELSTMSGVSSSHLGRVERGERFPSAHVLKRIAKPFGFEESELLALAGYLTSPSIKPDVTAGNTTKQLDPLVAGILAQEPPEVQRAVIAILTMLKNIARFTD